MACNFEYLSDLMGGNSDAIIKIMDFFLVQAPEELASLNKAILIRDYATIKKVAHSMKSTLSIMGVLIVLPVLKEMQDLGDKAIAIEKITLLNNQLNAICKRAFGEIEKEKSHYV